MSAEFADTNVVLYLLDDGAKADRAEVILGQGPRISVQVLNEALTAQSKDIASLVSEVALQAGRCQITQLSLTLDGTAHNFCPQTSTTQRVSSRPNVIHRVSP